MHTPCHSNSDEAEGFLEAFLAQESEEVLDVLLANRTTGRTIVWADDEHASLGAGFGPDDEMTIGRIVGKHSNNVLPRHAKERERQSLRTKSRAEIFTPKRVVVHMVDLFEQENPGCFDDPSHTFADLYMKSGLFITEVVKRLYNSPAMREAIPDDRSRLDHIIEHQVFGIAPTEIIYQIATHYILGYDDEMGAGCKHNFVCADSAQMAKDGTLAAFVKETFGGAIAR